MDPIPLEARAFGFFRKHKTGEEVNAVSREPHDCEESMSWGQINSPSSSIIHFLLD